MEILSVTNVDYTSQIGKLQFFNFFYIDFVGAPPLKIKIKLFNFF